LLACDRCCILPAVAYLRIGCCRGLGRLRVGSVVAPPSGGCGVGGLRRGLVGLLLGLLLFLLLGLLLHFVVLVRIIQLRQLRRVKRRGGGRLFGLRGRDGLHRRRGRRVGVRRHRRRACRRQTAQEVGNAM